MDGEREGAEDAPTGAGARVPAMTATVSCVAGPGASLPPARWRRDDGMATVEYALVTVAAAGFAGLLLVILRSDEVRGMLVDILRGALGG